MGVLWSSGPDIGEKPLNTINTQQDTSSVGWAKGGQKKGVNEPEYKYK